MSSPRPTTVLLGIGYHERLNGAQIGLLELARSLPALGYRPIVVTVGEGRATAALREAGIDVRVLAAPAAFSRFNKAWLGRGTLWKLWALAVGLPKLTFHVFRLARGEDVALFHANEPRALLLFGWGAKLARRPVILHARGSMRGVYPGLLWELIQLLPERIIRDGEAITDDMRPAHRSKARIAYEGPYNRGRETTQRGKSERPATVATVASFIPYKGYHHLLEAVPLVNDELGPGACRFVWYGETIDESYLRQLRSRIEELGVRNVDVRGWTADIAEVFREATLYVQPTVDHEVIEIDGERKEIWSAEGIPRSVLEALAHGVPAVTSDVGSLSEAVLDGSTGILVPPGNPTALATAITSLLRRPEERMRMGGRGITLVDERFTLGAFVGATTSAYAELLSVGPASGT